MTRDELNQLTPLIKMSEQHTCAVHDVLMNGLQDQISNIEKGQDELKHNIKNGQDEIKDFILQAHSESLKHIQISTDKNREDIAKIQYKLDSTIDKFQERDREYLMTVNSLKTKHAMITGFGISAATILTFLLNMTRIVEVITN